MLLFKATLPIAALFLNRDKFIQNSLSFLLASSSFSSNAASAISLPKMPTMPPPNGVLIFCHGSGDTGPGVKQYVESIAPATSLRTLRNAGITIRYPSAKPIPYKLMGNSVTSIWFDRNGGMAPSYPEEVMSIKESSDAINAIIDEYVEAGVPPEKIVLGGFSMGGGIGLQAAARCRHGLGAVFALSSYLCDDSLVYDILLERKQKSCSSAPKDDGVGSSSRHDEEEVVSCGSEDGDGGFVPALLTSPVFMAHGDDDDFVLTEWGEGTADRLKGLGVNIVPQPFLRIPYAHHEMTREELRLLFDFLMSNVF